MFYRLILAIVRTGASASHAHRRTAPFILNTLGGGPETMAGSIHSLLRGKEGATSGAMLNIDCKAVSIAVPHNKGSSDAPRAADYIVLAISRSDGLLIHLSRAQPRPFTSEAALRAILPNIGALTRMLEDPDTPPDERIVVNADLGLREIKKIWLGADVRMPRGGRRGRGNASPEDLARARQSAAGRSVLEQVFRRIDAYRLVGDTFTGTVDEFGDTLSIVSGLVNLQVLAHDEGPEKKGSGKGRPYQASGRS